MSVETRPAIAVASRSMTNRVSIGGERSMTRNLDAYVRHTDRAVRPTNGLAGFSKLTGPIPSAHIDKAVRSFKTDGLTLKPLSRINTSTALAIRPEQRNQMARLPRMTMVRPAQTERRTMQQPTRRIHFQEVKPHRSPLNNKTVTFSDLTYAKTFPLGNKDLYFNSRTKASEQTLFQKTLTPSKTENLVNRPTIKAITPILEKKVAIPNRLKDTTVQIKELHKPFLTTTQLEKTKTSSFNNHIKPETFVSNNVFASPKHVKEYSKPAVSHLKLEKPDATRFIPSSKEKIQQEITHATALAPAVYKQVATEVDTQMLHHVKAQVHEIIATPTVVNERGLSTMQATQEKPKVSNKRAVMLLAKVGNAEANEKKNPLSQEKRVRFRKFVLSIFQKIDLEKQKRRERKEKMKLRNTKKLYLIHDKKAMQSRESILHRTINRIARKNKVTGQTTVDMREVANQLPVHPSRSLISRIRFQWRALLFTGISLDGTWDRVRTQAGGLGLMDPVSATKAGEGIVKLNPAVEQSESLTAPTASPEEVRNVFGMSLAA